MKAGWGSLEGRRSLRFWAVAFLWCGSSIASFTIEHFSLSLRVCLSDDLFKTLYSVCFAAANKYYMLVGELQIYCVYFVVCWR